MDLMEITEKERLSREEAAARLLKSKTKIGSNPVHFVAEPVERVMWRRP